VILKKKKTREIFLGIASFLIAKVEKNASLGTASFIFSATVFTGSHKKILGLFELNT